MEGTTQAQRASMSSVLKQRPGVKGGFPVKVKYKWITGGNKTGVWG